MERKRSTSSVNAQEELPPAETSDYVSIAQIQGLIHLLDNSDVAELEIKRVSEGIHLVLRKIKGTDGTVLTGEVVSTAASNGTAPVGESHKQNIVSSLVGVFHPWLKQRGGTLAAVGDRVKAGQIVGTIESLNVFNEVEATIAGRIVEIHVQDGQPVEYGQVLVTVDGSDAEDM